MKKIFLLLLALPLFLGACSDDKEDDKDNGLDGTVWIYTEETDGMIEYQSTIEFGKKDYANYSYRVNKGELQEFKDYGTYTYDAPNVTVKGTKGGFRAVISGNTMSIPGENGNTIYLKK